jgi:DNA-binding GntR family transcriptional regulator
MRQSAKIKDLVSMFAADKEFHEIMWGVAGNPVLMKALNTLLLPFFGFMASNGYFANRQNLGRVVREHQELLDALCGKDRNRARKIFVDGHSRLAAVFTMPERETRRTSGAKGRKK